MAKIFFQLMRQNGDRKQASHLVWRKCHDYLKIAKKRDSSYVPWQSKIRIGLQ
jgi:hypothetical protein